MKKALVLFCICLSINLSAFADEPVVPTMRPAAPDVRSEVPADESDYLPNVIKQHKDLEKKQDKPKVVEPEPVTDEEYVDDEDGEEYEDEEEQETTTETKQTSDSPNPTDKVEAETNPINNDVTNENIQNGNVVPSSASEGVSGKEITKRVKQERKELKKQRKAEKEALKKAKPKYWKYKDADTDPYIQDWEKQKLEEENNTSEGEVSTDSEEKPAKTYSQDDYEQIYRDMQVPTFTFVHGVDPDQYYDMKDTTWSPYPLLRLNSPIYFKTITIEPGYYLLTPREYKGDWYILFKEAGVVKYTIPVFDKSYTPADYYRNNLKEVEMSRSGRWQVKFLNAWGKYIRKSKRRPAVKCNMELTDLDNNFLLLDVYYGAHKYSTIFRIEKF